MSPTFSKENTQEINFDNIKAIKPPSIKLKTIEQLKKDITTKNQRTMIKAIEAKPDITTKNN